VAAELSSRIAAALEAGGDPAQIVVDPGLGFAKTAEQSLALLADFSAVRALGYPVMIGASRKSFLAGGNVPPRERVIQSVAAALAAARGGAALLRVHDVAETVRALRDPIGAGVEVGACDEIAREASSRGEAEGSLSQACDSQRDPSSALPPRDDGMRGAAISSQPLGVGIEAH
jgi:dihydropteroate synthase